MTLLFFTYFALNAHALSQTESLEKLRSKCVSNSLADGKDQEEVCKCIVTNYKNGLKEEEILFLWKTQDKTTKLSELSEPEEKILAFDLLVTDNCLQDANWRWKPEPIKVKTGPAGLGKSIQPQRKK